MSKFTDMTWKKTKAFCNGNAKGMPSVRFKRWQVSRVWQPWLCNSGLAGRVILCNAFGNQSKIDKNVCPSLSSPWKLPSSLWLSSLPFDISICFENFLSGGLMMTLFSLINSLLWHPVFFCPGNIIPAVGSVIVLGNPWVNCWPSKGSNISISIPYFPLGKYSAGDKPILILSHLNNILWTDPYEALEKEFNRQWNYSYCF